jgi:hypothetical protein
MNGPIMIRDWCLTFNCKITKTCILIIITHQEAFFAQCKTAGIKNSSQRVFKIMSNYYLIAPYN